MLNNKKKPILLALFLLLVVILSFCRTDAATPGSSRVKTDVGFEFRANSDRRAMRDQLGIAMFHRCRLDVDGRLLLNFFSSWLGFRLVTFQNRNQRFGILSCPTFWSLKARTVIAKSSTISMRLPPQEPLLHLDEKRETQLPANCNLQ